MLKYFPCISQIHERKQNLTKFSRLTICGVKSNYECYPMLQPLFVSTTLWLGILDGTVSERASSHNHIPRFFYHQDISADDAHTLYSLLSVLQVELPGILKPTPESQVSQYPFIFSEASGN